ncbi:BRO1-like domain-containing protein [Haematococcus lacustris]
MPTVFSKQLATHCKKTDNVDLKGPLASYVKATYTHSDAEDAADDLLSIQQLRNEIVLAHSNAGTPGLRDSLAKYYRSLTAIETRFPISKEKGHAAVAFTWYEAFRPAKKATQTNIHFEKAGVLFNYGAVIGQAALNCDRTSPEGLVQATKLFQEAAGVFVLLREGPASKTDTPRPADLTPECIMVMEKLMLAQAQECAYHKANLDKKSPTLVARLAKQTQVMYEEVARAFAAPSLAGIFDKLWVSHTALKAAIYDVEMLAQVAKGMHAEDKVNLEVAVLREAFQRLQAAKKLARGETSDIVDSVQRVQEAITLALGRAEKDNNSIFLQRVPAFLDTGVSVQGACLVQPFKPAALDLATENLFSHLVPDTSAKALSRYTDMVDDVVRGLRDKLASATDNARIKLRELELPETLDALDPRSNSNYAASCLPDRLRAELEDIQSIGGLTHLNGILAEIGDLRKDVEQDLQAAAAALDSDAQEDLEMRTKFGEAWRIQASATATKPNWDRISQYRQSMTKAGDSDQGVMKRMADHEHGFKRLAIDAAALSMPRLQAPIVAMGPEDPAQVVAALRKDLDGLQVLAGERGGMEEALRDVKNKDNILPRLMTVPPQGHEALFASELKKYEALSADIERNCSAQADLLDRVERDNRLFRLAFDIQGWHNACETAATDIKQEVKAFKELLDHCSEGLRFYLGMSEVVRRCRQESEDLAFTRRVQREETAQVGGSCREAAWPQSGPWPLAPGPSLAVLVVASRAQGQQCSNMEEELAQITQRSVAAIVEVAGLGAPPPSHRCCMASCWA